MTLSICLHGHRSLFLFIIIVTVVRLWLVFIQVGNLCDLC